MSPICFDCSHPIPKSATEICDEIADVARWSEFNGYGVLPGIEEAIFENRTDNMVGSRIRVRNGDGSSHVEEVLTWQSGEKVVLKFQDFSPPLSKLATHFTEEWVFKVQDNTTLVTRTFQMFPKSAFTRPFLWLISLLFRKAVAHHLSEIATS